MIGCSLRIYRGLQLMREEAQTIITREYKELKCDPAGSDFFGLIAFAEGYECLDFVKGLGLERIYFLFYDLSLHRKADMEEVLNALEEALKLPFKIRSLGMYLDILFFLHERYKQTRELKRVTFRFLDWFPPR